MVFNHTDIAGFDLNTFSKDISRDQGLVGIVCNSKTKEIEIKNLIQESRLTNWFADILKISDKDSQESKNLLLQVTELISKSKADSIFIETVITDQKELVEILVIPTEKSQAILNFRSCSYLFSNLQAVKQSKEHLNDMYENLPIGLFKIKPDGSFVYANRWFCKILGFSSYSNLKKHKFFGFIKDDKQVVKRLKKLTQNEKIKDEEALFTKKDGSGAWCVITAYANKESKEERTIEGYLYDISERKRAIAELKENKGLFQAIAMNLKNIIYIFNQEGRFLYINPYGEELTGYSRDEINKLVFYEIIHPDFRDIVKERGENRLEGKRAPKSYEFKILTKEGKEIWLEITATRIIYENEPVVVGIGNDITERKSAIDAIKLSEERYKSMYSFFRLMLDNVPDMIWAKDLAGNYIFANKSLCDNLLLANNTEEPISKTDEYFANRAQRENLNNDKWYTFGAGNAAADEKVLREKKALKYIKDGYIKGIKTYLDISKSPLWDDEGRMIGTVGSARNVTESKLIEEAQKREEAIRNVVFNIGSAVNVTKDLSELFTVIRLELSKIINTTNLFIALYNKEKQELTLPYFIDEKDRFRVIPARKTLTHYLIKKGKPMLLHEKDYMRLAQQKEIEITGSLARVWLGVPLIVKGETIGALVIQNYDDAEAFNEDDLNLMKFVTNQISTSIHQKMADDRLRENEFALRQIIDNVPVMIYAKDKNLRFTFINKALATAYGKSIHEIEGRLQSEVHTIDEEIERFMKDDLSVIQNDHVVERKEETFTTTDGSKRILQSIKIPLHTGQEGGSVLLGVSVDITDRIKSEEELMSAKTKAEEADKLKTAFLANMSHEIRTPMNAIIGFSELLNDSELSTENRKEFIDLISENSKLLLNLIEDIIDVAKIEAEQIKIVNSTCKVNQLIDELVYNYSNQLDKENRRNIEIYAKKAVDDQNFSIITDPLRFKQIMNNLLGNAIKFTAKGSIEVGYYMQSTDEIVFFVKDTGIGLAGDKLEIIFERFRQAEESSTKEYGGTGLGLTISRKLVELLGGNIWVESVLNQGSTFYFSIPLEKAKAISGISDFSPSEQNIFNWHGKTILVAEDEPSNFELIKATLLKTGVDLLWAKNGLEAIELYKSKKNSIDLILMDMRMPEINGYDAAKRVRSLNKEIPIISLTAYAMAEDKEKSLAAGCNDYVSKPFNPIDLKRKINHLMIIK